MTEPTDFDDEPKTEPDATRIPFDDDLEAEIEEVDENTPQPSTYAHCPECSDGVNGRGLVRVGDFVPPPKSAEEAQRLEDCVATQDMSWRWCAVTFFFKGSVRVYWGPERRARDAGAPGGFERRGFLSVIDSKGDRR